MTGTHPIFNQAEPLVGHDLFEGNEPLRDALRASDMDLTALRALGKRLGSAQMQTHARLANLHKPVLHRHSPQGRRIDTVEFHPSYHALMDAAVGAGLHGSPWIEGQAHAHVHRAAAFMMFSELEPSVLCPISMTYAVMPALRGNLAVYQDWAARLGSRRYDPSALAWPHKSGLTIGMGMTEKQGGSDVRANTTVAVADGHDAWGARYSVPGHKWFFSAPMSDAFLVLAQTAGGLSCLFMPRVLADGSLNTWRIERLKDKLGNHANASAEVEFDDAMAYLVGQEGRGIAQILEMGTLTRLDCALGTTGLMRAALSLALNHAHQRHAFGKALIEQPLMRNVLADLALECEAAIALCLRLARAIDGRGQAHEAAMARLLTPIAKFWICKRGSAFAQEAMECLGGNGYVEEGGLSPMARIYREMPLNSIWEGSGNIMALDLLRALRQSGAIDALCDELKAVQGLDAQLDLRLARLPARVEELAAAGQARVLLQELALLMQAAGLLQHAPAAVAAAFCASRLSAAAPVFGALPESAPLQLLLDRAMPRYPSAAHNPGDPL